MANPKNPSKPDPSQGPTTTPTAVPTLIPPPFEDLGMRPGEEPFVPNSKGFMASGPEATIMGRAGVQLTREDLDELHHAYAGSTPMVPDQGGSLDLNNIPPREDPEVNKRRRQLEAERTNKEALRKMQETKLEDELLTGFQASTPETGAPLKGNPANPAGFFAAAADASIGANTQGGIIPTPLETPTYAPSQVGDAARLLEALMVRVTKARSDGDFKMASELMGMAQGVLLSNNLKRSQPKQERHPALSKLLANLGLEKIKTADIEWLGSTWRFAPRPVPLDWWVGDNMGTDAMELNYSIIAAGLVGLDGVPLYKIYNLALNATYTLTVQEGKPPQTISVPVYQKYCESCSGEVPLDADLCPLCGALLDIFDVPLDLRLRYAIHTKRFLFEKLTLDNTHLQHLVTLYRTTLKDRRLDKEELYPLLKLLPRPQEEAQEDSLKR